MSVVVRPAVEADAAAIAAVLGDGTTSDVWIARLDDRPDEVLVVAEDDAAGIVGVAHARLVDDDPGGFGSELLALVVAPTFRRGGCGTALLAAAVRGVHMAGVQSLRAWAPTDGPARSWAVRRGGTPCGERIRSDIVEHAYGWDDVLPLAV